MSATVPGVNAHRTYRCCEHALYLKPGVAVVTIVTIHARDNEKKPVRNRTGFFGQP